MAENEKSTPMGKAIKDTMSLELTRPVITRLRNRLKELKELTQAKSEKETRGNMKIWHTEAPSMFINNLDAKMEDGKGIITYTKYKMKDGNKEVKIAKGKSPYTDKEIEVNAEYVIDYQIIETIEKYKPLRSERIE